MNPKLKMEYIFALKIFSFVEFHPVICGSLFEISTVAVNIAKKIYYLQNVLQSKF